MTRTETYWICEDCAEKKNWIPPKSAVTMIRGLCGHCEREDEAFLIPTRDFRKPRPEHVAP